MTAVFKRKPGNNMGRKKLNLGETIFFVLFILLAAFILFVSPLFEIQRMIVEGNQELTTEEIIVKSGISTGINIFKVNLSQAAARIKELPMVKEIYIYRDFPGRIVFKVTERKPVAILPAKDGFITLDTDGVYCRSARLGERGLPVITGITAAVPPAGQLIQNQNLAVVLDVIKNFPVELVANLSEVNLDKNGQVILYTLAGIKCQLGYPENVAKKGTVLIQVLNELKGKQIEYIDLSRLSAPVVKVSS